MESRKFYWISYYTSIFILIMLQLNSNELLVYLVATPLYGFLAWKLITFVRSFCFSTARMNSARTLRDTPPPKLQPSTQIPTISVSCPILFISYQRNFQYNN